MLCGDSSSSGTLIPNFQGVQQGYGFENFVRLGVSQDLSSVSQHCQLTLPNFLPTDPKP